MTLTPATLSLLTPWSALTSRFAIPPAEPDDLHRPLNIAANRVSDTLCQREQRYVGAAHLPLRPQTDHPGTQQDFRAPCGQYVELHEFVSHTAIVENNGSATPWRLRRSRISNKQFTSGSAGRRSHQDSYGRCWPIGANPRIRRKELARTTYALFLSVMVEPSHPGEGSAFRG